MRPAPKPKPGPYWIQTHRATPRWQIAELRDDGLWYVAGDQVPYGAVAKFVPIVPPNPDAARAT